MDPQPQLDTGRDGEPRAHGITPGRMALLAAVVVVIVVGIWLLQGGQFLPGQGTEAGGSSSSDSDSALPPARVGSPAPDFVVRDLDGNSVRLSDLRGKTVFINFWATWCPPCRAEMAEIQSVYEEYKDQGVVFLLLNQREDPEVVRKYVQSMNLTVPVYLDRSGEVSNRFRVNSLPTTFFVDPKGVVSEMALGSLNRSAMIRRIERAK